ncbi:DksA/TraR family C4-type zinc finger protein [Denitrificimonas caeni]|uniref:DksA/TraR family C4-type zinc finger protein n=1 Tax=Denitrificimonas caeni TaxID=521720 RepID=UPI00196473F5|nr:DksA/TraR family C4-type zinc finger protein [Denitrificimonas caeni]
MATGWAHDGAVQEQIDSTIDDAVERVRQQLPQGPSAEYCQNCDQLIAEGRRQAIPGVQLCIACQTLEDKQASFSGYNRRGSKDSQLR